MQKDEVDKLWLHTLSQCNEVQRRRLAGIKALEIGWGGVSRVCDLTGMSHHTVLKGIREVKNKKKQRITRLRKEGGGRKKMIKKNPKIKEIIDGILEENTAGDPMCLIKWTNKSTYAIAEELKLRKESVSEDTVARMIRQEGYTLQANRKSRESGNSKERDSQFRHINQQAKKFTKKRNPIISVDTKKKELVGNFENAGRRWLKRGQAEIVNVYDFESLAKGKAVPYGIYDANKNNGFVNVGISNDTAEFAVESIKKWWEHIGKNNYPKAKELLICADSGGSNGNRNKTWKYFLQRFSNKAKISVTVCRYPPGTSKWNKIEHRMFSFISMNWRGRPLRSYKHVINLIRATRTKKGLKIDAKLDRKIYKRGMKIPEEEFDKINIKHHSINSQWNYTIIPIKN